MSHARIEEVSDSDSDPSESAISDLDDFDERDILRARPSQITPPVKASEHLINPAAIPKAAPKPFAASDETQFQSTTDDSKYKNYQCLYPIYFDKNKSRAEGRRVGKKNAVENPMAREIASACGRLRLETVFEPAKMHPKDWSNPGRVKVRVKGANDPLVKNKHHLYILISTHLKENPTTEDMARKLKVPGAPPPDPNKPYPRPFVPRGWKINRIIPYYSPAMTGGGVSEDFFKDMMKEMQGQAPGALPAIASSAGKGVGQAKKKKDKKAKG